MSSSLTIKNLTIVFSRVQRPLWAIKDLSFSLSVNQRVGVIGESGCGKSSLLKAITSLLKGDRTDFLRGKKITNSFGKRDGKN